MKMKASYTILPILLWISISGSIDAQPLQVRGNYFLDRQGNPFFWCADTSWDLISDYDREQAQEYLETRAEQGFNVIVTTLLDVSARENVPNAYGDLALESGIIANPVETQGRDFNNPDSYDYWDHAQWIIEQASNLGITIALVPCMGEFIAPEAAGGHIRTADQGYQYGNWVGQRFAAFNNSVVWMLGGGKAPDEVFSGATIWTAIAEGITDGVRGISVFDGSADYQFTCMSYIDRWLSRTWFDEADWIDFHTWGSARDRRNDLGAIEKPSTNRLYEERTPVLNAFPAYELMALSDGDGQFDAFDIRQTAYWSVFGGAAGHTYGCDVDATIQQALVAEGATQMGYLKNLMVSRPFYTAVESRKIIAANPYDPVGYLAATLGEGYAMVYTPTGKTFSVDLAMIPFTEIRAWWFDPRVGIALETTMNCEKDAGGLCTFDPPGEPARGNDWVLVLDDTGMPFPVPGVIPE